MIEKERIGLETVLTRFHKASNPARLEGAKHDARGLAEICDEVMSISALITIMILELSDRLKSFDPIHCLSTVDQHVEKQPNIGTTKNLYMPALVTAEMRGKAAAYIQWLHQSMQHIDHFLHTPQALSTGWQTKPFTMVTGPISDHASYIKEESDEDLVGGLSRMSKEKCNENLKTLTTAFLLRWERIMKYHKETKIGKILNRDPGQKINILVANFHRRLERIRTKYLSAEERELLTSLAKHHYGAKSMQEFFRTSDIASLPGMCIPYSVIIS